MNIRIPGSPWLRVVAVVAAAAGVGALVWWRGPDWGTVWHAFDAVKWYWVVAAIGLNLLSVIARAFAWQEIEIVGRPKPAVRLSGRVAARAAAVGATSIDLSMTHSRERAQAVAVVDA